METKPLTKKQSDFFYKDFPITSVCRADLKEKFTTKQVERFTNDDMRRLASKMADAYCENGFWIDLGILGESILEDKSNETIKG